MKNTWIARVSQEGNYDRFELHLSGKIYVLSLEDGEKIAREILALLGTDVAQLEDELQQLKEDCKPFSAQIDQAKTYKVNLHTLSKALGGE